MLKYFIKPYQENRKGIQRMRQRDNCPREGKSKRKLSGTEQEGEGTHERVSVKGEMNDKVNLRKGSHLCLNFSFHSDAYLNGHIFGLKVLHSWVDA